MVGWLEDRASMTDAEFLALVLADGKAHTTNEILQASFKERGCGLTVHSRIADLRKKKGLNIDCRRIGHKHGRAVYEYQLTPFREPQSSVFSGNEPLDEEHGGAGRGSPNGEQLALVPGYPRERFA